MNQEETQMLSGYEASSAEIQNIIMEWVRATEAFHCRYAKLTKMINTLRSKARGQKLADREKLLRLITLQHQMGDALMTLVLDMSGQRPGRSTLPSKFGQLDSHARLLDELNRQIDLEMIGTPPSSSMAQA